MAFSHPINDRYFEDYVEGDVHTFGSIAVEADEISPSRTFDPQRFHIDPEAARQRRSAASSLAAGIPLG